MATLAVHYPPVIFILLSEQHEQIPSTDNELSELTSSCQTDSLLVYPLYKPKVNTHYKLFTRKNKVLHFDLVSMVNSKMFPYNLNGKPD